MTLWLIIKLLVVVFFLIMFLRRSKLIWGVGLLTVTSAVLLDTFLGTFNREEMLNELGFFFYVIGGALFGGAAVWMWGVLRPMTATTAVSVSSPPPMKDESSEVATASPGSSSKTAFDRQMLYNEIRNRFGREDLLDLIFDLEIQENEVMTLNQDMNQLIINVMDLAEQRNQTGNLALAVERILTPVPPDHLPRREKLNEDSPPTVLRQYLLAYYPLLDLRRMATVLGIDWEQLSISNKRAMVRNLLLYLYRRNRIGELLDLMQDSPGDTIEEE